MAIPKGINFSDMPGWCAGIKMSNVNNITVRTLNWEDIVERVVCYENVASCVCVSVNVEEERVIKWLKENKFRRGPCVRNWGHDGRKTYMYFKQITKRDWIRHGGKDNW